jgi:hypothetical protein
LNLDLEAPVNYRKGKIVNLGNPVNRKKIPFWNWVAENVHSRDKLDFLPKIPDFSLLSATSEAILAFNYSFLDKYGVRWSRDHNF